MKRQFIDAPDTLRCEYPAKVGRSNERGRCGRYKKVGNYCRQHAKIIEAERHQRVLDDFGTQG